MNRILPNSLLSRRNDWFRGVALLIEAGPGGESCAGLGSIARQLAVIRD